MQRIDVFCPLYKAKKNINTLIEGIKKQNYIENVDLLFMITLSDERDDDYVINILKINKIKYIMINKKEFSHSRSRSLLIKKYSQNKYSIFLSQDVILYNSLSFYNLVSYCSRNELVYCFGRQICNKKNIERYVRQYNYPLKSNIIEKTIDLSIRDIFSSDAFSIYDNDIFKEINGYDNIDLQMSEDMYYSQKVLSLGYKKGYCSTAIVEHYHNLNLHQLYKRYKNTGIYFSSNSFFSTLNENNEAYKLFIYILVESIKKFDLLTIFKLIPNMLARYLGMRSGKLNK